MQIPAYTDFCTLQMCCRHTLHSKVNIKLKKIKRQFPNKVKWLNGLPVQCTRAVRSSQMSSRQYLFWVSLFLNHHFVISSFLYTVCDWFLFLWYTNVSACDRMPIAIRKIKLCNAISNYARFSFAYNKIHFKFTNYNFFSFSFVVCRRIHFYFYRNRYTRMHNSGEKKKTYILFCHTMHEIEEKPLTAINKNS